MVDYMVIVLGCLLCQVVVIVEKLVQCLKEQIGCSVWIEGKEIGDWVLIDIDDVIVYVFCFEVCEFYQLEKMWMFVDVLCLVMLDWMWVDYVVEEVCCQN